MLLCTRNEVGIGLDGRTLFNGAGFLPKVTFDLLDNLSYLAMVSGTLGGSMLRFLGNLVYFHSYGHTSWFGRSYYFHSKCTSPPAIVVYKKFVEGRYDRT
jgi:hypothetical protein